MKSGLRKATGEPKAAQEGPRAAQKKPEDLFCVMPLQTVQEQPEKSSGGTPRQAKIAQGFRTPLRLVRLAMKLTVLFAWGIEKMASKSKLRFFCVQHFPKLDS